MSNEVEVNVSADGSSVVTEFDRIGNAAIDMARQSSRAGVDTEEAFDNAARSTGRLGEALDTAQGGLGQLGEAFDGVGQSAQAVQDIMQHGERKAEQLAQAQQDVEQAANDAAQAMQDLQQANRDAAQSGIDAEQAAIDQKQALLDEAAAQKDYNEAVKKFGANSEEAKQAQNDINQAKLDGKQATEDLRQAEEDEKQAKLDATQASSDYKQAQLDSAAANRELEESGSALTAVAEWGGMLSGVVSGLTGVLGIVTIAQWAWNASLLANPITWIVALIVGLIAVIVLVATKTKFFQTIWKNVWGWAKNFFSDQLNNIKRIGGVVIGFIVTTVQTMPKRIRSALSSLAETITSPFKRAFNAIANLWNRTVGSISFSIPNWVPGVGGNSFSVPNIPTFAVGGDILRTGLALIHRGETVVPTAQAQRFRNFPDIEEIRRRAVRRTGSDGSDVKVIVEFKPSGNPVEDALLEIMSRSMRVRAVIDDGIRKTVSNKGGSVQVAYGRRGVS